MVGGWLLSIIRPAVAFGWLGLWKAQGDCDVQFLVKLTLHLLH